MSPPELTTIEPALATFSEAVAPGVAAFGTGVSCPGVPRKVQCHESKSKSIGHIACVLWDVDEEITSFSLRLRHAFTCEKRAAKGKNCMPNIYRIYLYLNNSKVLKVLVSTIYIISYTYLLRNLPWAVPAFSKIAAFLHTFVAQHTGRGAGEGMLCDLIPKSPQSGWDMVGHIQEVWEGKKVESRLSAQKSILKATRPSGFFRSWNYIEYLRKEIQCVWCWWKFYWLGCKMQPQIRNWNPGDRPHNLQLAWVLTACAVSSISMPQIRAPPKILHNKKESLFLLSKGVRACFHGFSGFFVKTMVELTGYQAISDKLCTLFKFVSWLHALHMQGK